MSENHAAERINKHCTWTEDIVEETWETDCENKFWFEAGGPKENDFKHCPYCGRPLQVKYYESEDEDE